jgi:hypothetical protein
VEVTAEGVTVSGDEQAPGGRRRLMQEDGDDSVSATGTVAQLSGQSSDGGTPPAFYKDGGTIKCPGVAVGATFDINGVTYTRVNQSTLKSLAENSSPQLTTSCTTGITDMSSLFYVRASPSRVLLFLRRCVDVVALHPSPRSKIATHSTRPPVSHCAVACACLQSAHRSLGRELGDDHE